MGKKGKYFTFIIAGLISLIFLSANAQYINNGILISIEKDGLMSINNGNFTNNGLIRNTGIMVSNRDIINNDTLEGQTDNSVFEIQGNWFNNHVFIPGQSTVILNGSNQLITGDSSSHFYNLDIKGNGVKTITNNSYIYNVLDLTDAELATNDNTLYVTNSDINAIRRTSGFVSSTADGKLVRNMDTSASYLFPTGSSDGIDRYRPIEITPKTSQTGSFGIRLANVSPSYDNLILIDTTLCMVNPNFYHKIFRLQGNEPVDIKMHYESVFDESWSLMGNWKNNLSWSKIEGVYNLENNALEIQNWDDFSSPNFALATHKPELELGEDIYVESDQSIQLNATYKGSTIDNIFWTPNQSLSCIDCLDPEALINSSTTYKLRVEDIHGCSVEDSISIIIRGLTYHIPNAFSPNDDGLNDHFAPMSGYTFEDFTVSIYSRWGEKIFESKNPEDGWDGTYRGEPSQSGSYFYIIKYRTLKDHYRSLSGNITLL